MKCVAMENLNICIQIKSLFSSDSHQNVDMINGSAFIYFYILFSVHLRLDFGGTIFSILIDESNYYDVQTINSTSENPSLSNY